VIASDPPNVVHLITRAQGGLHDYQGLLHEAGHALHYAGVDPALPYTFRRLSRDHALTEIYSFLLESVSREPGWHAEHFDVSGGEAEENAEATRFLDVLLFRRYAAKLDYELELWADFEHAPDYAPKYAEHLRAATGFRYRPDGYLADMDDGFYSADYLRAWIRAAAAPRVSARDDRVGLVGAERDGRFPARPLRRGHPALGARTSPPGLVSSRSTRGRSSRSSSPRHRRVDEIERPRTRDASDFVPIIGKRHVRGDPTSLHAG
jgi:hypothetical protein